MNAIGAAYLYTILKSSSSSRLVVIEYVGLYVAWYWIHSC